MQYELLPTRKASGATRPKGWVKLEIKGTSRRTMTEGYLNQRLPRNNTIAQNQNYVTKVLDNPRTPQCNRQAVIDYVMCHQDKFIALSDRTDNEELNEWARKKNGGARFGFIRDFKLRYTGGERP